MPNYREPYEDHQRMFDEALERTDLKRVVDVKILANDKLKEMGKVRKANNIVNYLNNYDVIIEFNEYVFEQLEEHQQQIIVDELIAPIHFDTDKNKVIINKPDIQTFSGIINKYGFEVYSNVNNVVKEALTQKEDDEKN